jgi:hypothetical protein
LNSRTITAWSANVWRSAISASVKRTHLSAEDRDRAKRPSLTEQWNLGDTTDGVEFEQLDRVGILRFRHEMNIVDDDSLPIQNCSPAREAPCQRKRSAHEPSHLGSGVCSVVEVVALQALDNGIACRT